ncbi:hypothetical protein [Oceanotoga phage vB_OteS-UFV02]
MNLYKLNIHTMGFHGMKETSFAVSYRGHPFPHELFDYEYKENSNVNDTSYNVTYDVSILTKLEARRDIIINTYKDKKYLSTYTAIYLSGNSDRGVYLIEKDDLEKLEQDENVTIFMGQDIYMPDGHNFNILKELYI